MKARFIKEIGTRAFLRVYWGAGKTVNGVWVPEPGCPSRPGSPHNAQLHLVDSDRVADWELGGRPTDYPDDRWPTQCEACGAPVPPDAERQVFNKRLYNTASGDPEPGDLFWADWYEHNGRCHIWGESCDGRHLMAILPNGRQWDIDGRANNCTMPNDNHHRCWIRHGEPPNITVDKAGVTCGAGAGSILSGDYHGFLIGGEFRP